MTAGSRCCEAPARATTSLAEILIHNGLRQKLEVEIAFGKTAVRFFPFHGRRQLANKINSFILLETVCIAGDFNELLKPNQRRLSGYLASNADQGCRIQRLGECLVLLTSLKRDGVFNVTSVTCLHLFNRLNNSLFKICLMRDLNTGSS